MKNYIIFGCGYCGRAVYRILKFKKKSILRWVDNDKKKAFKKLFGILISPVSKLKNIKYDKIIFSGRDIHEQLKQYENLKLDKKKIEIWDNFKLIQPQKIIQYKELSSHKILKNIIIILEKNKIFYWVDASGLLQLIRNNKISLLSDFDLSFNYEDHKKILNIFKTNNFFTVKKKKLSKDKWKIFIIGKNDFKKYEPACFDFHFKIKKRKYIVDAFNTKRKIPIKYLKTFKKLRLNKNVLLNVPKNSIQYLQFLYGKKDWKKRVRFFKNPLAKKNRPFLGPIDGN